MAVLMRVSVLTLVVVAVAGPAPAHDEGQVPAGNGTWPLDPRPTVVAGFDPPAAPWAPGHRGIDLAGRVGQPVLAVLPGEIAFTGSIGGKPVVVVDHGTTRTTYEPVVAAVVVGDVVPAGAVVGHLVALASHCAPATCLHLGWIRNADDVYLDPLELLGVLPVRLWPWARAHGSDASARAPSSQPGEHGGPVTDLTRAAVAGGLIGQS